MSHFSNLKQHVPGLETAEILDIGSGKGGFLVSAAQAGAHATGLEFNQEYIGLAQSAAQEAGVVISVVQGTGEQLPFSDEQFDFINLSEVIEHVHNPDIVLREVWRVLKPGGYVYVSLPNRFGFIDQHFHLVGVNWIPRTWSHTFITLFGAHKQYDDLSAGLQRLSDMHYYTFTQVRMLVQRVGFEYSDIRMLKINALRPGFMRAAYRCVYRAARAIYFDSFHLLLKKP